MRSQDVLIKWTGSKRLQVPKIICHFPQKIKTYFEPFIGGGSVLFSILTSQIEVQNIECSDINKDLICIWQTVKTNPQIIIDFYKENWHKIDQQFYNELKLQHNETPDPRKFFMILRLCRNGLVRYNKSGKFNSSFHYGRKGVNPDQIEKTILNWHKLLKKVNFSCRSYSEIQSSIGDILYLDPPYFSENEFYFDKFDFSPFLEWLSQQKAAYFLSLNVDFDFPKHLYDKCYLIAGKNSFNQLLGKNICCQHSLYAKV